MKYSIIIMTHKYNEAIPVQNSIKPLKSKIFIGKNYPSFSKLVNDSITYAKNEIVILLSYKVRPTEKNIIEMVKLINEGFGLVCFYKFALFGFKKDLIRKIGFFDERYIKGYYEDCDFIRRVFLNNIAIYQINRVPYIKKKSTWGINNNESFIFYKKKWLNDEKNGKIYKLLSEEIYNYNIGKYLNSSFMTKDKSICEHPSMKLYMNFSYSNISPF